jgi:uncharacterized protein YecT (DUF1311 family)
MTVPRTRRPVLVFACAGLVAVLAAAPVHAQDDDPASCKNPQTQTDMTICAGRAADAAERRMRAALARTRAAHAATAALLDSAQAAWSAYARRECDFEGAEFEGGSLQPMIEGQCSRGLAEQREQALARPPEPLAACARAADRARCAEAERAAADAALNAAYRELRLVIAKDGYKLEDRRDYDPSLRTRGDILLSAERAWIRYRDAQCAWEGATASASPAGRAACAARLTRARTAELRDAIDADR